MSDHLPGNGPALQTELIEALLKDKKSERLWKNIRTFTIVGLVGLYVASGLIGLSSIKDDEMTEPDGKRASYVSVVRISGEIGADKDASAERLNPILAKAFSDKESKGVILVVNSPGGTPVQASLIHDRIVELKNEHKKKVVVVAEDMLTSGAYLIAVGADKIAVNRSTLTGSIGVISQSFGFTGLMDKVGVERRTLHAGAHKNRMDPFGPVQPEDRKKTEELLSDIHAHFIDTVKQGRKDKLKGEPDELFTGDYWAGDQAIRLGLADEISDLPKVMEKDFGVKKTKEYSNSRPIWERLTKSVTSEVAASFRAQTGTQVTLLPQ